MSALRSVCESLSAQSVLALTLGLSVVISALRSRWLLLMAGALAYLSACAGEGPTESRSASEAPSTSSSRAHQRESPPPPKGEVCASSCKGKASKEIVAALEVEVARTRACYNAALRADPTLEGPIRVRVRIDEDGEVCSARIEESTMPVGMNECVLDVIEDASYPAPTGGCIDVRIPLVFQPQRPDGNMQADAAPSSP